MGGLSMQSPEQRSGASGDVSVDNLTSGAYASETIRRLSRRLETLQVDVLADDEREPLHQFRVSLRRLRTVLQLFGPALLLPKGVSAARLADVARRTSLSRDLDVLRIRLNNDIAPLLPAEEQKQLTRLLKDLEEDRRRAFLTLVEALSGKRFRKLLSRLSRWLQEPRYSTLGGLPLRPWAYEWLAPITAGVFLEEGWFCQDRHGESLHRLRKRLKAMRYAIETLRPLLHPPLQAWLENLKTAQDHLGDIHDLQVLQQALEGKQRPSGAGQPLPGLRANLDNQQQQHWQAWLTLRDSLMGQRAQISRDILLIGQP
ncbi:MAG: hypothetical protein RLZZ609_1574 [Cyanobacteriota bacterium]|jgi:CHAD domain-containing protein